jgi:hypothetical protein
MNKIYCIVLVCLSLWPKAYGQHYSITAFGTDQISASQIQEAYGTELDELLKLYDDNRKEYEVQKQVLEAKLNERGSYAYINLQYFKSYANSISFIIDFVELADSAARLNFKPTPTRSLADPENLITQWRAYAKLSFTLFKNGEINDMECPVIHCTWSFNHPELKPFLDYFSTYAPKHKNELTTILLEANAIKYRAAAAFLLVHAEMPVQELVDLEMAAINDPSSSVRNNCLRVLYYAVRADNQITIDIDKIVEALDYPSFTDRNKALVILRSIPLNNLSTSQLSRLIPILLEILEKKDAHNYRNAHLVIKKISQMEYSADDLSNWHEWANNLRLSK